MFILLVLAYFVIVVDVSIAEKIVFAVLCTWASLFPVFVENSHVLAAVMQGVLGVYVCLRMTYIRAKA